MKVLMTGATGRIGSVARTALAGRYEEMRLLVRTPADPVHDSETVAVGDVRDFESVRAAVRGCDVIVHLAGISDEAAFDDLLDANVRGTYNIYRAALEEGVRRVVYASSNHVIGFYSTDERVDASSPPRPDTLYAVTKVFGESLARLYFDKWGLESVCLRIGSFRERPEDVRQLSTWLSHRDGAELIASAIEAQDVGFQVAFGVSANTRSWWSESSGAHAIGFVPVDDAEEYAEVLGARDDRGITPALQGGAFTSAEYTGGIG